MAAPPSPRLLTRTLSRTMDQQDLRLHRSLSVRRMSQEMAKTELDAIKSSSSMFDQFFIIGVPPESTEPKPQILTMYPSTQYPQTDSELEQIVSFCLPAQLEEVEDTDRILLSEFVFYFHKEQGTTVYGICVQIRAPPESTPFFADRTTRKWPFCLCMLTQQPFLSAHFQFLSYLALALCGKVLCGIKPGQRKPTAVRGFCHPSLTLDRTSPAIAVWPKMRAPLMLIDSLCHYMELPVDLQEKPVIDERLCATMPITIPLNLSKAQCLSYPTLDVLFSALDIDTIVKLYTCMLLERSILFISQSPHKSSLAVIALTCLLQPYKSIATVMPVVPDTPAFRTLLESPIPYVAGSTISVSNADVIVNLDTDVVKREKGIAEIPRFEELKRKLSMIIECRLEEISAPPALKKGMFNRMVRNPDFEDFVKRSSVYSLPHKFALGWRQKYIFVPVMTDSIREVFAAHLANDMSEKMKPFFVTDSTDYENPVTVLNLDLFLGQLEEHEKAFYTQFSLTQVFHNFSTRNAKECEVSRNAGKTAVKKVDPWFMRSPTKRLSPFTADHYNLDL